MPYASIQGLRFYYELEGKGPPLVLIAGYTCDLTIWNLVREELAKHFQLLLFDNRGAGRTECPQESFTIEQMAEDTMALIQHLRLSRPHILGHSMGGCIAQSIAYNVPNEVGKTIFAQTRLKMNPCAVAVFRASLHLTENGVPLRLRGEVVLPWIFSKAFLSDPKLCEIYLENLEKEAYPISVEGQRKQGEALIHFDSHAWYHKITTPTLILCGDEDLLCPPEDSYLMEKGISGSKLYVFQNFGHMAQIERPQEFCRVISKFLVES